MFKATGWLITPLIRALALRKQQTADAAIAKQKLILKKLVKKARKTQFGRDHEFARIDDLKSYQEHVPIRSYEEFHETYWNAGFPALDNVTWPGRIPYFAKTSGTTSGVSKFIPCTREMVRSNNRAGMEVILAHFRNRPSSKILHGRYFMFAGSPKLQQLSNGVFAGELSGIAARETPAWAGRERYYPSDDLAAIGDWQTKLDRISLDCLDKDIRAISGLPSWLQILFQRIAAQASSGKDRLSDWFPDLQLIVHGGMGFEPYRQHFQKLAEGTDIDFREIYAASEGFFGIADRGIAEGMRLIVGNGVFYEFVPLDRYHEENPPRHWLGNVEVGVDYVLVVTTCAGLWSYVVGDIVRFVDISQFRVLFAGRLSQTLSKFGEKVLIDEVEAALGAVMGRYGAILDDYSISSYFEQGKGRHLYILELSGQGDLGPAEHVAEEIDKTLKSENAGYATRRRDDVGILVPKVVFVKQGTFSSWMGAKGKAGGQHKVPRTVDREHVQELRATSDGLRSKID